MNVWSDPDRDRVYRALDGELESFVRTLTDYARVPTVSAERQQFAEGADATRRILQEAGARVHSLTAEGGPPVVVGEIEEDPASAWIVMYNHYDVQPVDPIAEWRSDPFDPVVRDGRLWARGVSDTKGNVVAQALAVRVLRDTIGRVPVNVRFLIEGEEESGSPHLDALAREHPRLFRARGATIEATGRAPDGRPVVALGSKGVLGVTLSVRTAAVDQHSSLAVTIPNAAWRLVELLGSLRTPQGRIRIPGFADGIRPADPEALRLLRRDTFDPEVYRTEYGATEVYGGRSRYQRLRRAYYSPTCTIDGISSGYTGPGHKTVNPAVARASLDFRLLPGQSPGSVLERLRAHLAAEGFSDVEVTVYDGFEPASTSPGAPFAVATRDAAREAYGVEPNVVPWSLGSSTTAYFTRVGTPALEPPGVGHAGGRAHAPNENIRLDDAPLALRAFATLLVRLGSEASPESAPERS